MYKGKKLSNDFPDFPVTLIFQITTDCRRRWRAKCNHVRTGGLLTTPLPTTMIMAESSTTSIVFTTSVTTITNRDVEKVIDECLNEIDVATEFDDSPEVDMIIKCAGVVINHHNHIKININSSENTLGLKFKL